MSSKLEDKSLLPNPFGTQIQPMIPSEGLLSGQSEYSAKKEKNFPFFFPIIYHNITMEIPQNSSSSVRFCLFSFYSFTLYLVFNFMSNLFSGNINSYLIIRWREILLDSIILVLFPIVLFYCQYYPFYCSAKDNAKNPKLIHMQFVVIFCFFLFFVGIPGTGLIGLGYAFVAFRYGAFINKILSFVMTTWGIVNVAFQVKVLFDISPIVTSFDADRLL